MAVVLPAAIASGSLVAQHVAGKATRDTLFLSHFGLGMLPAAMIGAAVVSSVAVIGISRALARYSPARVVPFTFGLGAVFFLLEWWLSLHDERSAAVAVYAHTAVFGSAGVSAFWSLVNERFDPSTAKKIVGRIASGGTVGGVIGGVVVWRASEHLSVPMMLALLAGINLVGLWGALRAAGTKDRRATAREGEARAGGAWKVVRETPYLRDLAWLVLAGAVIQALLDWLLSAHATELYGKGPKLLGFFALFNMIVGVASFAAQTSLAQPLLQRVGLAGTVKWQPTTVGIFGVLTLLSPQMTSVVLLRGAEAVTRNSLYRSAYELFYTPLPTAKKRATKTLIDVGADRVGTALGSAALLVFVHFGSAFASRAVLVAVLGVAAFAYYLSSSLHDGYVSALAASLKSGAVALDADDAHDLTTKRTLAETTALLDRDKLLARIEQFQREKGARTQAAPQSVREPPASIAATTAIDPARDPLLLRATALRSSDVAQVRAALASPLPPALASFAIPLLENDAVVRDVVRALRKIAPRATGQLVDALLDRETDVRVRRRIPRVLAVCRTQRAAAGLMLALEDPVFEVRVEVGLALARMIDEAQLTIASDDVFDVAHHELTTGRASWRRPAPEGEASTDGEIHRGLAHVFTLLGLVLEREPLSIAHRALRSEDPGLRGTAYEYLDVVLPARLRDVVIPLLGDVKPSARSEGTQERGSKELADELLRSSASLPRPSR
ncbi:MAG: hypothetical protein KF819_00115 [Labilithrix sp.]|nr:hypothetical protein [Labilithrix sp.]